MEKQVVTGVLVKNSEGKLLLVKKSDGVGPYAGMYLTPGGGVKTGELADEAALREVYEETGVRVENLQRVIFDDAVTANWQGVKMHFIMLLYTADYVAGDLQSTKGDDDNLEIIDWFTIDELKKLHLSPPLARLVIKLGYLK